VKTPSAFYFPATWIIALPAGSTNDGDVTSGVKDLNGAERLTSVAEMEARLQC